MHFMMDVRIWFWALFLGSQLAHGLESSKRAGYCEFPEFLWNLGDNGKEPVWVTRTQYNDFTSDWSSRQEVKVNPTEYLVTLAKRAACQHEATNLSYPCETKRVYESAICLSEEPGQKYRIQIQRNGKPYFTCVRFVKRNTNIVQIWAANEQKVNEDRLCYDTFLDRVPWPWIAKEHTEWSFCPIVGGFDFKTRLNGNKKHVCSHQWRPSRLESECILGEGMQFFFPDERCSMFANQDTSHTLFCWGSWTEDEYMFIIMGHRKNYPQYAMRVPKDFSSHPVKESTAYFYYSPVCPLRGRGRPPSNVTYAELVIQRSGTGVCYDESPQCQTFANEGKCTSVALHKIANYCKKSCGLCGHSADLVPSVVPECYFPTEWRGDWLWYERERVDDVKIGPGQVSISHLGSFICKGKHWLHKQYKMMSYYSNGCRPRYTCMQFRKHGRTLKFQLSKSNTGDRSFELCTFKDDPPPLRRTIRSSNMKVLLPRQGTQFNSCGLLGQLEINVTFPTAHMCTGSVSDWDNGECAEKDVLKLSVYPCSRFDWKDYRCLSHTAITDDYAVVHTRDRDTGTLSIQCWVVQTTKNEATGGDVWKTATLLDTGQCGDIEQDEQVTLFTGAMLQFTRTNSNLVKKCYSSQWVSPTATERMQIVSNSELSKYSTLRENESRLFGDSLTKYSIPTRASNANRIRDTQGEDIAHSNMSNIHTSDPVAMILLHVCIVMYLLL